MTNDLTKRLDVALNMDDFDLCQIMMTKDGSNLVRSALNFTKAMQPRPIEEAPKGEVIYGYCFEDYDQPCIHTEVIDYSDGPAYICKALVTEQFLSVTHFAPLPDQALKDLEEALK